MTLQTLKIGGREFVLLAKQDFEKLAAQADRQSEDDYWTDAALAAEAAARAKKQMPIPFADVEREIDKRSRSAPAGKRTGRGRR